MRLVYDKTEENHIKARLRINNNKYAQKILNLVTHKDMSISEIKRELKLSYAYVWEIVKLLEYLGFVMTYELKNKKGKPQMVKHLIYPFVKETSMDLFKAIENDIKKKGEAWINQDFKNKQKKEIHEMYREFVCSYLKKEKVWNKYDIILRKRK